MSFLQKLKPTYFISANEILLYRLQNLLRYPLEEMLRESVLNSALRIGSWEQSTWREVALRQESEKMRAGSSPFSSLFPRWLMFSVSEIETSGTDTKLSFKQSIPHFLGLSYQKGMLVESAFLKGWEIHVQLPGNWYFSSQHCCGI